MNANRQLRWLAQLTLLTIVGCSGGAMTDGPERLSLNAEMQADDQVTGFQGGGDEVSGSTDGTTNLRKIVYTASVEIVVEDFDALEDNLQTLIKKYECFIASSNTHVAHRDRRQGTWTIRVPLNSFDSFLEDSKQLGELLATGIDSQDRTEEYYDLEAALGNKRKTLVRFEALAEQHQGDLEHIREVEKDIERVQGEIDRLTGRIRLLENLTSLTTVTLTATEINDYVPAEAPTFGTEISRSFTQSISSLTFAGRQLTIFSVAAAPWLVILLAVIVVFRFAWRRVSRRER